MTLTRIFELIAIRWFRRRLDAAIARLASARLREVEALAESPEAQPMRDPKRVESEWRAVYEMMLSQSNSAANLAAYGRPYIVVDKGTKVDVEALTRGGRFYSQIADQTNAAKHLLRPPGSTITPEEADADWLRLPAPWDQK